MIDVAKLRKVHAMTTSPNPHEAAVAWGKVDGILKAGGKSRRHLRGLLGETTEKPADPAPSAGPFAGFAEWMEQQEPGYGARMAREAAERRQRQKDELAELLRRYGSMEALEADNAMQAAVEAAVAPYKGKVKHRFANGVFEIDGLDGWYDGLFIDRAPDRVKAAIVDALPMPSTVTEAKAEYDAWEARDRELGLAWDRLDDTQLSLPCRIRCEMVRQMLDTGLRARSLEEVLVRQRHLVERGHHDEAIERAVLADLEHLAGEDRASEPVSPVHTGASLVNGPGEPPSRAVMVAAQAIYERRYGQPWSTAFPSVQCSAINDATAALQALVGAGVIGATADREAAHG